MGIVDVLLGRSSDGLELRRGTVLVLHGWASRTEHMKSLIEGFLAAGYRVVSLDLPGHGGSSGRRLTMASAVDAVQVAGQWFGPFAAAIGHSFGGAVALNAAAGSVKGIPPLAVSGCGPYASLEAPFGSERVAIATGFTGATTAFPPGAASEWTSSRMNTPAPPFGPAKTCTPPPG